MTERRQLLLVYGVGFALLGAGMLGGAPMVAPSYAVIFALIPYTVWAIAFLLAGLMGIGGALLPCMWHLRILALAGYASMSAWWAVGFLVAWHQGLLTGITGPVIWGVNAAVCGLLSRRGTR